MLFLARGAAMTPAMPLLLTALAFFGGILLAVQGPTNAMLGRAAGSPLLAALISFVVGTLALAALTVATGAWRWNPELRAVPWFVWIGGFYGAVFVAVAAVAAPRIGVGALLTAAVAGQLIAALVLDHYGLLGVPRHPAGWMRVAGIVLVFAGAVLVRRG